MSDPSWTPRRRGAFFCAPACGRGCLKVEHDAAVRLARTMASHLGTGWKPEVWENLGWHAKAVDSSGRWEVCANKDFKGKVCHYTAYLGDARIQGGIWVEQAKTPVDAVKKTLATARKNVLALNALLYDPFNVDARRALRRERRRAAMSPAEKAEYDSRMPDAVRRKSRAR